MNTDLKKSQRAVQVLVPAQHVALRRAVNRGAVFLILLFAACTLHTKSHHMNIKVSLEIFSGRPNPVWQLTADECTAVMRLLEALPETSPAENTGGLGYSGFLLSVTPEEAGAKVYQVHVFQKIITVDSAGRKFYRDEHGLEKWLLQQASAKGYGAITDSL